MMMMEQRRICRRHHCRRRTHSNNAPGISAAILFMITVVVTRASSNAQDNNLVPLNPDSVVLITGAAGFIGSHLARTLYRVYGVRELVLLDSLEHFRSNNDRDDNDNNAATHGRRSQTDLGLLEFQRQRLFYTLQTLGPHAHFYRHDVRRIIPEFYQSSQLPVLPFVLARHPNVTHIIHLADAYHRPVPEQNHHPAVPRQGKRRTGSADDDHFRAGLWESVLETVRVFCVEQDRALPHIVYASSYEVYDRVFQDQALDEATPIAASMSLAGTAKLLDELLAREFYETLSVPSIGLRIFNVYGPWSLPGSPLFGAAERLVGTRSATGNTASPTSSRLTEAQWNATSLWQGLLPNDDNLLDQVRDYVQVDDVVDAIMSAMQWPAPQAVLMNVGSGQATTLRQLGQMMLQLVFLGQDSPLLSADTTTSSSNETPVSYAVASLARAQTYLNYAPQVSLQQGLENLLAWHYDRAFPFGNAGDDNRTPSSIAQKGLLSCSKFDEECLNGMPVFPCASECAHVAQCLPTVLDALPAYIRALTAHCEHVLYTVQLDEGLTHLVSTTAQVSSQSQPHLTDQRCNVAVVNVASPLVQRSKAEQQQKDALLQHGFWTLAPVINVMEHSAQLELLVKLSPGLLFGRNVQRAVFVHPNVLVDQVPRLLNEAAMQPHHKTVQSKTTVLIGTFSKPETTAAGGVNTNYELKSSAESVQDAAYRAIRISLFDEMTDDDVTPHIDNVAFLVHLLQDEDSRLFRCDVLGEVTQWMVPTDGPALEFVLGLHDMWSRVMSRAEGQEPWWNGDTAVTVPERNRDGGVVHDEHRRHRRLQEVESDGEKVDAMVEEKGDTSEEEDEVAVGKGEQGEEEEIDDAAVETTDAETDTADAVVHNGFGGAVVEEIVERKDADKKQREMDDEQDGADGASVDPVETDDAASDKRAAGTVDDATSTRTTMTGQTTYQHARRHHHRQDLSSYDTWLGILSSTAVRRFARIVPAKAIGAVYWTDNDDNGGGVVQ